MFAGYTNAALVRFATTPKVHTIAHVSEGHTLAALMHIATIPKGLTTVHVNLDSLGVEENARVSISLRMLSKRKRIF